MNRFLILSAFLIPTLLQAQYDVNGDYKINGNVGIGTTNPIADLHLVKDGNIAYLNGFSYRNASGGFGILGYSARGSETSPSTLVANDNLLWLRGMGYDGSAYHRVAHITLNAESVSTGTVPGYISFQTNAGGGTTNLVERLRINSEGNVGIGTTNPDMKLTVKGKIHAEEVKIDLNVPAPDYVFKKEYNLRSIEEVERFVMQNNHLPEIPSAKEFEQDGILQAEMDMNLLKKIEELTLYTIQQQKEIKELKGLVKILLESKK